MSQAELFWGGLIIGLLLGFASGNILACSWGGCIAHGKNYKMKVRPHAD